MTTPEKKPFQIAIPRKYFLAIDQISKDVYGVNLEGLSREDPHAAYRFVRDALVNAFVGNPAENISMQFESGIKVTSDEDGHDAAHAVVRNIMEETVPVIIVEPLEVVVMAMRQPPDEGGELLRFSVEPNNYA